MQTEIPGQHLIQRCVIIQRDDKGYGLTVTGDNPVYVQFVIVGGAADRAGVRVGDKIVKVNGTLVTNSNHKEVVSLIKGGSYVALTLLGKPPSTGRVPVSPTSPPGNGKLSSTGGMNSPTSPGWDSSEEKIYNIRRYLEQEQLFIKNIETQYNDKPTPKLRKELAESTKRAKALEQELNALTSNRNSFLPPSGESSPTELVFDPPESSSSSSPMLKRRNLSDSSAFFDNVNSSQPNIVTTQASDEHLNEHGRSDYTDFHTSPGKLFPEKSTSLGSNTKPLRRKPVLRTSNRSLSLPGATKNQEIFKAVCEAEENNRHDDNSDFKENEDFSDACVDSSLPGMGESQQQIVSMDDDEFPSDEEKCEDHGPFNDLTLLKNKPAHLAVFLHYLISNSDPSSLLFWIVSDGYEEGSAKDMRKWIYEIYSTFLVDGAPLKVEAEFMAEGIKKIEESVLGSQKCIEETLRSLLKPLRSAAAKEVSLFLSDFRAKRALGLGSLFGDHQLEDDNMDWNKEITVVEQTLLPHLDNLVVELNSYSVNLAVSPDIGIIQQIFKSEALACAIATFMKQVGIIYKAAAPSTHVLEKCKTFMHKEAGTSFLRSAKKDKKKVFKQHTFHATVYSSTTYCNLCRQLLWGIGYQGYQCQVCEYNVHKRHCLSVIDEPCTGKKKEKIVTKPEAERRSSTTTGKINENGNLVLSPDDRKIFDNVPSLGNLDVEHDESSIRPVSFIDQHVKGKVNRSTSVMTKADYTKRHAKIRSRTVEVGSSVFIPGVSSRPTPDQSLFVESGEEDTTDSDLDVPNEMPSIKENIDPKIYSTLKGKERKRLELINELIHTERTHVRTLKVLHKVFYKPWSKAKIEHGNIRKYLFPNLDELIQIHKSLVEAMRKRQATNEYVDEIGDLLLDRFDDQAGEEAKEAFAKFCQSQNYALELLKVKLRKERKLDEFIQQCESNPLCRKLSLQGIISSSYQRLTKYPLFIEALIKATPASNNDQPRLKKVLLICKQMLEYVNQAVKEFEDHQRLAEFNRRLDKRSIESANHKMMEDFKNLDLTKHKLIFDGPLTWRMNQTKNIDLHALLLEDLLVLLQMQDDKYVLKCQSMTMTGYQNNKTTHSPILKLSSVLTRNVATDKKAFFVVGTSEVGPQIYELVAATLSERKNWFKFITEAIEVCKGKERGRRNALAMPTTMKHATDEENQESANVEKDDKDKEKAEKEETEENTDVHKEAGKDASEEKDHDSGETSEPIKDKAIDNLLEEKRSQSVDDLTNEISVDSPTKNAYSDSPVFADGGFDTDGSTEGSKKLTPSGEDASETSGASSSRSSVELMELLKQKDEEIKKLLEEKSHLVKEIGGTPSTEGISSNEGPVSHKSLDARNLIVSSILEVNRLTGAVTSILNPSERNEQSENSEENPLPPQQQLAKSTAVLNEHLTTLLHVIGDMDMNRERLRCDLQYANAQIQKLKQERNSRSSCSHPSHTDETFLPNYDEQQGNWDAVNERLAVPDNFHDVSTPKRSSSFSNCSESSRSSRSSNRNSLIMNDLTDSCDV